MDAPWQGDAVSLVEAFRSGERSPVEELAGPPATRGISTARLVGRPAVRHREQLLLDVAVVMERERPWPLVAPGAPY